MSETNADYTEYVDTLTASARRAALAMLSTSTDRKNAALSAVAAGGGTPSREVPVTLQNRDKTPKRLARMMQSHFTARRSGRA